MRRLFLALSVLALAAGCKTAPEPVPEAPKPPETPAPPPEDPNAFRQQPPKPGEPPELVLPKFEQARLDNGLTVLVSTRKELPLVYTGVAFAAGGSQDPKGKWGLADVSYKMLLEGAAGKDTTALDQAFQDLGVSPSVSVSPDGAFVGARVLKRHADAALALLSDVTRKPNLAQKDFDRRKKLQLAELVRAMGSPGFLAQQAYLDAVFGPEHPYGHPVSGLPATVDTLTLQDVKAFYGKSVGPKAAALVMTGDITLEEAVGLAKKYFGDWKSNAQPPPVPPTPAATPRQQVVFVPKPGLDQTMIVVGRPGIAVGHPDEYALDLATTVFGGFFGSRLNMNLREDKGYSYGAGASADARLGVGPLTASSAVRKDVTGPALGEFFGEMKGIQERPITEKELAAAREGLIRAIPGEFESVEGLGSSAASLFFLRRPMDEYARTVEGLEKATPAEVQRVAEAYLGPAAMQVVLVGDPAVIQEQVGPLNLGKLVAKEPVAPPSKK
ncbi:putative Zn-dependent peptidase [Archangium gephyra]|uniref:Peptidase, M16 family n=1 Tax=Archangium gephyra TaxID=48 RepID=A0AAC8Q0U0_9BACT|nr:pitrilysin family protein [Archangium gephyra]AKI98848.1 peptidase, M16 family [Archangium gephyra]REG30766.1 putative Zn-dependent peptidase [Archangium gephyra]